ncbi:MAG: ATP-binding protein, partial [Candidatus Omnitrophica bacterium]|nr:ATP-binding protein [Candidatus Omnitrophota bacterium]
SSYSESELETLRILSGSVGLAILNAIFMHELKKTQLELAESSRIAQIGYLASSIEHQINNLLNNIVQAGNFILEELKENPQSTKEAQKVISDIIKNAQDGSLIIDELRSYAKREEDVKFSLINLKDVLEKVLKVLYIQVGKFQNIDIKINIDKDVPLILGSFVGLENVFINLLNNCYDAISKMLAYIKEHPELEIKEYKGKIEVNITREKDQIHIHIIDNGFGMTEEVKKKIFTPLYTTKASFDKRREKAITGGTGIGLYTILIIIKNHGGTIRVYRTEPLKGTDFLITLPVPKETGG